MRELEVLSRRSATTFDDAALARLDTMRRGLSGRSERAVLAAVLDRLDPDRSRRERGTVQGQPASDGSPAVDQRTAAPPTDPTETAAYRRARGRYASASDDDARVAALSDLARIGRLAAAPDLLLGFGATSPAARERAAVLLSDLGAVATWPTLRAAFEAEREQAVREAIVRAAGYLGGADDVAWVTTNATGPAWVRARCFAYARIRTPAALLVLATEGERARAATPPDAAIAALVDHLAGPVFEKTDPALLRRLAATSAPR